MRVGTLGCSNSSDLVGDSWPVVLGERLNCEIIQWSSPGSGNEALMIEKLVSLINFNPDFIVIQLSEISRMTLGIDRHRSIHPDDYASGHHFEGQSYYTFNAYNNIPGLTSWAKMEWTESDNKKMSNFLWTDYNQEFKVFHTLSNIENIRSVSGIPIYIWSWFVDIHKLYKKYTKWQSYIDIEKIMPGNCDDFKKQGEFHKDIKKYIAPCNHWYRPGHEYIVDEFLLPFLEKHGISSK